MLVERTMASRTVSKRARMEDNEGISGGSKMVGENITQRKKRLMLSFAPRQAYKKFQPKDGRWTGFDKINEVDRSLRCQIETEANHVSQSVCPPACTWSVRRSHIFRTKGTQSSASDEQRRISFQSINQSARNEMQAQIRSVVSNRGNSTQA